MRGTPLTKMVELPNWHSKGGGFSRTALGRPPHNRLSQCEKRNDLGVLFPPCPGWPCQGFLPALGSLVRFPCPDVFLSVFFSFFGRRPKYRSVPSVGRGRQVPAPGGRDVGSDARAPTQELAYSGFPFRQYFFLTWFPPHRCLCPVWRSVRGGARVQPRLGTFSLKGLFHIVCWWASLVVATWPVSSWHMMDSGDISSVSLQPCASGRQTGSTMRQVLWDFGV